MPIAAALLAVALGGCGTIATRDETPPRRPRSPRRRRPRRRTRPGGYYLDDGPGDNPPANLDSIPEPTPRIEPLHRAAARPYVVMGRSYTPMTALAPYKAWGLATWYGRRYHGKPTSTGEIYDMYAMTAAHPTLPLPSYARVTHLKTGKSVVVRVNDRGPFHEGRIIDLSYTAAHRLGILGGATMVEVESIIPRQRRDHCRRLNRRRSHPINRPAPSSQRRCLKRQRNRPRQTRPAAGPGLSVISPAAAEPLPATAAAPAQVPVTTEAGRVYLQLGAFGSRENAESYLARAEGAGGLAGVAGLSPATGCSACRPGPMRTRSRRGRSPNVSAWRWASSRWCSRAVMGDDGDGVSSRLRKPYCGAHSA